MISVMNKMFGFVSFTDTNAPLEGLELPLCDQGFSLG